MDVQVNRHLALCPVAFFLVTNGPAPAGPPRNLMLLGCALNLKVRY